MEQPSSHKEDLELKLENIHSPEVFQSLISANSKTAKNLEYIS